MKKIGIIAVIVLVTSTVFAQKAFKEATWGIGEDKTINGAVIKRTEGENSGINITNITYSSQAKLIDDAKNSKLAGDKLKSRIAEYKKYGPGGMVVLYFSRESRDHGDTESYTMVVKDSKGKEIHRKKLKSKSPKKSMKGDGYYNSDKLYIPKKVKAPFTVEIIEDTGHGNVSYIFEISKF